MSGQVRISRTTSNRRSNRNLMTATTWLCCCTTMSLGFRGARAALWGNKAIHSSLAFFISSKIRSHRPQSVSTLAQFTTTSSYGGRVNKVVSLKNRGSTTSNIYSFTTTTSSDTVTTSSSSSYDLINKEQGLGKYEWLAFEKEIYNWWENSGCFKPDAKYQREEGTATTTTGTTSNDNKKKPYVLPMPPPNVTGRLHMGHAIFVAIQDILARFHRMRGRPVLWLPGTDHAGIATQLQVEKRLIAEGTTREQVGREEFLRRALEYKDEQGGHITRQLRSLGASADWSRERYTMDKDLSDAVIEAFVRLHEKGLIYRGEYMVNWAPLLKTAVSDLEVEYSEEEGKLYYFKYMVDGSDDEYLPVATTRPETIFGDTAVCVHPQDERYKHLVGKHAVVPLSNGRSIPIIADEYVDMDFGTGALKITPGHDPNDYELGKKFGLPIMNIMNKDGSMNSKAGRYDGLDRFDCREKMWKEMEEQGLTIKVQPHMQRIPRSQRGGEVIEPMVSSQWFVATEQMGAKALKAVNDGDISILPPRFDKIWNNWLTDIHDWCISRQLWWGHRIPVWYVGPTGFSTYVVARNEEEARQKATELGHPVDVILRQDEDVLDTWFSSGLWPFATVGWPQDDGKPDSDLARFYPATCLETGYDILFFWVARMVMMGLELTGQSPFSVIYLHGLVRAADGSKMSKTKGNVIDPLDTVFQFGADSLRYSLVTGVTPGQDIPFSLDKVEANRNFANKLWNCCKFVTGNALKGIHGQEFDNLGVSGPMSQKEFDNLLLPERYIVSKCHYLVESVTADIENYQLGAAGSKIYEFLWDQFADWYVEISKTRLYEGAGGGNTNDAEAVAARRVLVYVLDTSLRLLHPYMPFVTEQLWHHLPRSVRQENAAAHALMLADWPQMDDETSLIVSDKAINQFECIQALIRSIRNVRAEYNVEPGKRISAVIVASGELKKEIEMEVRTLVALAKLDLPNVHVYEAGTEDSRSATTIAAVNIVVQDGVEAYLPLSGLVDPEKERLRLEKQYDKLIQEAEKLSSRLNSNGFVDKAPKAVVDKVRAELQELESQASKVQSSLSTLLST